LDVNKLPNSVLIPPADTLFVRSAVTTTATLAGFTIKQLVMFEDVNFPSPGSSYVPLYYPSQSPSLKPQYALGSLTYISWRAACGISISSVSGINAAQAGKSVKGYSASGRVKPGYFFESLSISGIKLGDLCVSGATLYDAQLGISVRVSSDPTQTASVSCSEPTCLNPIQTPSGTVSFSARVNDRVALGGSLALFARQAGIPAIGVSGSLGPFRFSGRLDQFEITSLSAGFNSSLNLGAMTGTYAISASGLEMGMTGLSMRLAIAQGMFSGNTSVSFAQSGTSFGFASLSTRIALRVSPGVITFQATFGRFGLARAAVSTGVAF